MRQSPLVPRLFPLAMRHLSLHWWWRLWTSGATNLNKKICIMQNINFNGSWFIDCLSLLKLFLYTYMDWVREGVNKRNLLVADMSATSPPRPYSINRTCLQLIVFLRLPFPYDLIIAICVLHTLSVLSICTDYSVHCLYAQCVQCTLKFSLNVQFTLPVLSMCAVCTISTQYV